MNFQRAASLFRISERPFRSALILLVISMLVGACRCTNSDTHPRFTSAHAAAHDGDLAAVKTFLGKGSGVGELDDRGRTLLHLAAMSANPELCEYLISIGTEVAAVDYDSMTAMDHAIKAGDAEVVSALLLHPWEAVESPAKPISPYVAAVWSDQSKAIRVLGRNGVSGVDALGGDGRTALSHAIADRLDECTDALLDVEADIDLGSDYWPSLWTIATQSGLHPDTYRVVISKPAFVARAKEEGSGLVVGLAISIMEFEDMALLDEVLKLGLIVRETELQHARGVMDLRPDLDASDVEELIDEIRKRSQALGLHR